MKRFSSITWAVVTIIMVGTLVFGCTEQTTTSNPTTSQTSSTTMTSTTSSTSTAVQPQYGGVLRLCDGMTISPADNLGYFADPKVNGPGPWAMPMAETLLHYNMGGDAQPWLATDYTIADDLGSITFILRQGVKYHDGTDFNAAATKWNIDQYIDSHHTAANALTSVDVIDDYIVRVNLKYFQNTVLASIGNMYMMSPTNYEKNGLDGVKSHPVGTGPFKFESYTAGVSIKYTRFDDYWQEGKPYLNGVEVLWIGDPLTRSAAFETGEIDVINLDLGKPEYDLQQKGYQVINKDMGQFVLAGDSKNPDSPWSKIEVRQALDYAIDKAGITAATSYSFQTPAYQLAFSGTPEWLNITNPRSYDPDIARQLLDQAGYSDGFDTTLYSTPAANPNKDQLVAIQADLANVGIRATIVYDEPTFAGIYFGGWENGLLNYGIPAMPNMNYAINVWYGPNSPFTPSLLKTPEFLELLDESLTSKDYDPVLVQKVTKYIYDTAMFTVVWTPQRGAVLKPFVHDGGWYTVGSLGWTPENTWLSER
ncbi:MAG: ABC transporter substrate-binding protein [Dehalococcoidales bacterium]|nr:ABC transporter substrate-binding protein [Dehalococcoidales bacterium]